MPITNSKFMKYPFAERGNRKEIPNDADPEGRVSWEQGYTVDYEQNPEAGGKYIERQEFNGTLHQVSAPIREMQINGVRLWDSDVASADGYPAGARVAVFLDFGTNKLSLSPDKFTHNGETIFMSNTIILVSLKDNNKDDPTFNNNIFKSWWLDDGNDLFHTKISLASSKDSYYPIPAGYLDVGSNTPDTTYKFADYPRVAFVKGKNALPDYIIDNRDETFSIKDLRGGFPRVWSNGSATVDQGRQFGDWQTDAIRNIEGWFAGGTSSHWQDQSYQIPDDKLFTIKDQVNWRGLAGGVPLNFEARPTTFNASRVVPTSNENRPHNFNIRMYLKI